MIGIFIYTDNNILTIYIFISCHNEDTDYDTNIPASFNEKLESFKTAYSNQLSLKNDAEKALNLRIEDRINQSLSAIPPPPSN